MPCGPNHNPQKFNIEPIGYVRNVSKQLGNLKTEDGAFVEDEQPAQLFASGAPSIFSPEIC